MTTYTYSIYDADTAAEVLGVARAEARSTGETCGEYADGDTLYVIVRDAVGGIVEHGYVTLSIEADERRRVERNPL